MKWVDVNPSANRVDQDCFFSLESLAREFMLVARLRKSLLKSKGNRYECKFVITLVRFWYGSPSQNKLEGTNPDSWCESANSH